MTESTGTICMARQAIYDGRRGVRAYELLFRDPRAREREAVSDREKTATTLVAALGDIGLASVVRGLTAWINVDRDFLVDDLAAVVNPDQAVIEILETVSVDDQLLEAVDRLRDAGFTIALDDFEYRLELEPLLERARWVKLDVRRAGVDGFREQAALVQGYGVQLLAEKVETIHEAKACEQLGATLFQGFAFSRPEGLTAKPLSPSEAASLELIRQVNDPTADFDDLERVVLRDVTLSYRFLRFVNSAYVGLTRPVSSMHDALVMVGLDRIRRWATLVTMAGLSESTPELVLTAATRAHLCEQLARASGNDPHEGFTVGLLSVLDALLGQPIAAVIDELPLAEQVKMALLEHEGPLGVGLDAALKYEDGEFEEAGEDFPLDELLNGYVGGLRAANEMESALS